MRPVDGNDHDEDAQTPAGGKSGKGKKNRNTSKKKQKKQRKAQKNRGKLILDATVAPADIKYPTDIYLLN